MDNQNGFPGALPSIPSGLEGGQVDLVPGEGFWARIEQIAVKGEMTRGLDTAMHGRPSPRIWLFLHEPGRGELSAAVAMSFARELAFRDQAALVLDCDDQDQALTRWAGRVETEGWIDLARYGTSVLTSGMPMPFVGRRGYLLGVGSFAPTDVTGTEVDTLLKRLRRQADDLLLVASADSAGLMWAPAASIRILCWDKQTVPSETAAGQARKFEEAGCPLTAVVTFQEAGATTEKLVEEVFAEVESPPEPVTPVLPVPPVVSEPEVPEEEVEVEETTADEVIAAEAEDNGPEKSGREDLPLERGSEPDPVDEEADERAAASSGWNGEDFELPGTEPAPARETSRVFWMGALIALAVIAAASTYYFKYMRVPAEGHFQQLEVATETGTPGYGEMTPAGTVTDSAAAVADAVEDSLSLSGDGESVETEVDHTALDQTGSDQVQSDPDLAESPVQVVDQPEVKDQETAAIVPAEVSEAAPAGFDMGPYREPVGQKGWALHVYSLPDSSGTVEQVGELDRRGFQSAVRIFDLGEKGRWRRIYLGSFASRAEAKQAMPALLAKLRVDWAKPEIFKSSAPE